MQEALAAVAPGRPLRAGLDRVLQAGRGALVVVGDPIGVRAVCSGGFPLDLPFTPQRLSELAKMDGAIVLSGDAGRIVMANVHLVPDASVPTRETGTRHRTAERMARSIDVPVVSVSEDLAIITVYRGDERHQLEPIPRLLSRANQALQTLERYRSHLDAVSANLSALEVEDLVALRDVVSVLQRAEMVARISDEVAAHLVELGDDGRLVELQLHELMRDVDDERRLVIRDYALVDDQRVVEDALSALSQLSTEALLDLRAVAAVLGRNDASVDLDGSVQPRGYRLLSRLPRLPEQVIERLVSHFGALPSLLAADVAELEEVKGIGDDRAGFVRDGLARLAQASILERYR
jgi:diadenylate cyclase